MFVGRHSRFSSVTEVISLEPDTLPVPDCVRESVGESVKAWSFHHTHGAIRHLNKHCSQLVDYGSLILLLLARGPFDFVGGMVRSGEIHWP